MTELIIAICTIGLFVLIGLIAWGVAELFNLIRTKRWARAKAKDVYLRMLIEGRDATWKRYSVAFDEWYECRKKIHELRNDNEYRTRAEIASRLAEADQLCERLGVLGETASALREEKDKARHDLEEYCAKKKYRPWGE
jgi:hypothetical protein